MKKEFANYLIENRTLETRWVTAKTPRGKIVAGALVSHDGSIATIKRNDGKLDFSAPLSNVHYR